MRSNTGSSGVYISVRQLVPDSRVKPPEENHQAKYSDQGSGSNGGSLSQSRHLVRRGLNCRFISFPVSSHLLVFIRHLDQSGISLAFCLTWSVTFYQFSKEKLKTSCLCTAVKFLFLSSVFIVVQPEYSKGHHPSTEPLARKISHGTEGECGV